MPVLKKWRNKRRVFVWKNNEMYSAIAIFGLMSLLYACKWQQHLMMVMTSSAVYSVRTASKLFQTRTPQYSADIIPNNELLLQYEGLRVSSALRAESLLEWLNWTGKCAEKWKYLRQADYIRCPSIRKLASRTHVRTCLCALLWRARFTNWKKEILHSL